MFLILKNLQKYGIFTTMNNVYDVVRQFESEVAKYCNSKYAVAVDSCSSALFLCCKYFKVKEITIPCKTYYSVPCSIINAGGKVSFENIEWSGCYQLKPYTIYDAACRFKRNMYINNSFMCLSFDIKKYLPIGKGGMILLDNKGALDWFRIMIFNGREEVPMGDKEPLMIGWNMYMEPEKAVRGLNLLNQISNKDHEDLNFDYPDLSKYNIYKN